MQGLPGFADQVAGMSGMGAPKAKKSYPTKKIIFIVVTIISIILFIIAAAFIGGDKKVGGGFMMVAAIFVCLGPWIYDVTKHVLKNR